MSEHDLVVRGGTVVDGTGAAPRTADVAVRDGRIVDVGRVAGRGSRDLDADGLLVTPGWVDIHTHYDGQATWDERLAPSSWHGVTTVVMGNCGVGFAPVHPHHHQALVELMEGVEDIPGTALHEGLSWEWESFGGYLDALESRAHDVDFAAQVPHGALRLYVMGERGAAGEPARAEDIDAMGEIASEAIAVGALGFSTSRTKNHRTSTGAYTPTLRAELAELAGIAAAIGRGGAGVLQVVSDFESARDELVLLREMMAVSGRPLSLSLAQTPGAPDSWKGILAFIDSVRAEGLEMRAQVAIRPIGVLLGLQATINPFNPSATYRAIAAELPDLAARAGRLADPDIRARVLDELGDGLFTVFGPVFPLGAVPNYEPQADASVAALAARAGTTPQEMLYDLLLEHEGRALIYAPVLNYVAGNLDHVEAMLQHPWCVPGLSDGGAHVGTICDGSFPTTLLQHWGRDRPHGRLPVELLVARQCRATAETVGLFDRGLITPGMRADLNVIDFDALAVEVPTMAYDLPAGGKRLLQRARGYEHTFVAGNETYCRGEATGALPGRLVRGAKPAPGLRQPAAGAGGAAR
jgi:N-acyl-D-aspartate/D-glutamate deacylase